MADSQPKLILLPALGTDGRLYDPQREVFPDLFVPPWIPPRDGENLPDYAQRMAQVLAEHETFILGGVSLGGMVAYEIARHLKPKALILIATCRSREGVNAFLRTAGHLWPVIPTKAFKMAKFLSSPFMKMFVNLTPEQRRLCVAMFTEMDSNFMHWAISAILNWTPVEHENVPIFQIHGGRDNIIPLKSVSPDEIVPEGGHLINLTHAGVVNEYIRHIIEQPKKT